MTFSNKYHPIFYFAETAITVEDEANFKVENFFDGGNVVITEKETNKSRQHY